MKIKVLAKRPDSKWYATDIENNLENLQRFVGGCIETVTLAHNLVVICDEEGRLKNKEYAGHVGGVDFVGDILIAGIKGENFADCPLTLAEARESRLIWDGV